MVAALLTAPAAHAQAPQPVAARDSNNPYNSPIRRANPNSRQGTAPATAPLPGSRSPIDNPRPPTLENRGIGNGDNLRRPVQPTAPSAPRAPSQNR